MTTTITAQVGSVVRYHGSIASEHWATFYISAIDGARYELIDRDYPTVTVLRHVRRESFTPTGEHVDLCACGHEVTRTIRGSDRCEFCGSECATHVSKEASA
jgi:hypothetical protein